MSFQRRENLRPPRVFPGWLLFAGTARRAAAVCAAFLASSGAGLNAQPDAPSVGAVRAERERLDRSVWAKELAAQEHEESFIALWDDLRTAKDKRAVLAAFPFSELKLGEAQAPRQLPWGIVETEFAVGRTLTPEQWNRQLAQWQDEGCELIETEWHHAAFDAANGAGPARSAISMTLHVTHPQSHRRLSIQGALQVEWSEERDARGRFIARTIDATRVKISERTGDPAFTEALAIDTPRLMAPGSYLQPVLLYDLDRDGLSEIVLPNQNAIYWNKGGFHFEKAKLRENLAPPVSISAAVFADFTGDGAPDLLLAGENMLPALFPADENGGFTVEPTTLPGDLADFHLPQAISAGDVDGDGRLDLFLAQYKQPYVLGQMPTPYYDANDGFKSFLYLNAGDGRFVDATESSGLAPKRLRRTYAASLVDLDEDGDLDLLVISDFSGVDVHRNDGQGRFQDVTSGALDERANFGMSHTFADFNGDGRLDFFVAGMGSTTARRLEHMRLGIAEFPEQSRMRMKMGYGNRMYLGQGGGVFRQAPFNDRVARTGWSWGCTAFDFGNDGAPDLYVANGHISGETARDYCTRFWTQDIHAGSSQPSPSLKRIFDAESPRRTGVSWNGFEHNALLLNAGGRNFIHAGFLMGAGFEFDSRAVLSDDLDGDGRVDLLVIEMKNAAYNYATERLHILKNEWPADAHWIGFRLADAPGVSPQGARVTVRAGGRTQRAVVVSGDSFRAQHAPAKHFGLGKTKGVESVEIRWAGGAVRTLKNPAVDRWHTILPPGRK